MSKFFHLSKRPAKSHKRNKVFFWPLFNLKTANIALAFLIVAFGLGYLLQVNGQATKGYQIKELEKRIADLRQEKSDLTLETLKRQSLGWVNEKLADLNMVGASQAEYLREKPVALANNGR